MILIIKVCGYKIKLMEKGKIDKERNEKELVGERKKEIKKEREKRKEGNTREDKK